MDENHEISTKIVKEWNEQFPFLKRYGAISLMLRTDIFLIGLYFRKTTYAGGSYIPEFVIYPLWDSTHWNHFSYIRSDVGSFLKNSRVRGSFYVKYEQHDHLFGRMVLSTKNHFGNVLNGLVPYDFLYEEAIAEYRQYGGKHCLWEKKQFLEYMFAISLYFEDEMLWDKTNRMYRKCSWLWEDRIRNNEMKTFKNWKDIISSVFESRETLLKTCEENSDIKKVMNLNKGSLVKTPIDLRDSLRHRAKNLYNRFFHPNLLQW